MIFTTLWLVSWKRPGLTFKGGEIAEHGLIPLHSVTFLICVYSVFTSLACTVMLVYGLHYRLRLLAWVGNIRPPVVEHLNMFTFGRSDAMLLDFLNKDFMPLENCMIP